jgi:hypothetical protein
MTIRTRPGKLPLPLEVPVRIVTPCPQHGQVIKVFGPTIKSSLDFISIQEKIYRKIYLTNSKQRSAPSTAQSSTFNSGTLENSLTLLVTTVRFFATHCAAI